MVTKEELHKRIDEMSDADVTSLSKSTPPPPSEPAPPPTPPKNLETELALAQEKLKTFETENKGLKEQLDKLKSSDTKVQAVKRAFPHMKVEGKTVDELYDFYEILKKENRVTDAAAAAEEEKAKYLKRYQELVKEKRENLVDALIEATKEAQTPQTVETISQKIEDWKEEGTIDIWDVNQKLTKLIHNALDFHQQESADKIKSKFGIPTFEQNLSTSKPYDPMGPWNKAIGGKK